MKKKALHIIFLLLLVLPLRAQNDYHPFKVDLGLLLGEVNAHDMGLIAPYVEPKYNINNHFSLGLRMEYIFYSKESFIDYDPNNSYWSDFDADGWGFSALLTSDYYFNNHYVRPFIGAGAGIYYSYISKTNSYLGEKEKALSFGYVPRMGLNIGQFRISCEYNFIVSDKLDLSYVSFKLGYEIGGGKKWF